MKEKIERLSKGIFEYEMPELLVSESRLDIVVEAGIRKEGSIRISNSAGQRMKGVLYVTGKILSLSRTDFIGAECEVEYDVDASTLQAGEEHIGTINIVSDCGECQIPFIIQVTEPSFPSSIGNIRDLFQFANLARLNWKEALELFASEDFSKVVLRKEPKYRPAYRKLLSSSDISQAMEEFLVLVHKKKPCKFGVAVQKAEYESETKNFMETLIVKKEQWGYVNIKIKTDSPYISLSKEEITTEDFVNGQAEVGFVVLAEQMKRGNYFAEIVLHGSRKKIRIPVVVKNHVEGENANLYGKNLHRLEYRLTELYLKFRNNEIASGNYISESVRLLESILVLLDKQDMESTDPAVKNQIEETKYKYELYRAYLSIVDGKNRGADDSYEMFLGRKSYFERNNKVLYCAVLYLEAMKSRDKQLVDEYAATIRRIYEQDNKEDLLLWFLLYMDKRLENSKLLRYETIKKHFGTKRVSRILAFEAAMIWNTEPMAVSDLESFECQVMQYLIKYKLISKEAALQFAYLSEKNNEPDELQIILLKKLYEQFRHRDILFALCKKLIRGDRRQRAEHPYYKQAVKEQLRLDRLHEYYIMTLDKTANQLIDQQALLYFSMTSFPSEEDAAFVYSYVVRNKDSNPAIHRAYLKKMEQFAVNQMKAGAISGSHAVLYADVLRTSIIDREMAQMLPELIFTYQVECKDETMQHVCVVHKEEKEVQMVPFELKNGVRQAFVQIYTENAELFLVDNLGRYFLMNQEDKMFRLLHVENFLENCYEIGSDNRKLLLHMWEKNKNYNRHDDMLMELQKQISQMEGLQEEVQNNCVVSLVEYYYDHYNVELLEAYLNAVNLKLLSTKDREKMLEMMILRDMYDKVIESVEIFGCSTGMHAKRLSKLCVRGIFSPQEERDRDTLLTMGFFAFKAGKVEDRLLQYLVDRYNGTTGDMCELWKAAKERELETTSLEERLLAQMLFAESYVEDSFAVFVSYCGSGMNRKLIRAYFSYCAYKYFVKDRLTSDDLFEMLKKESFLENNQICVLALLKFYSGKATLMEAEKSFVNYHIQRLVQKKIIFGFYKDFEDKVSLPAYMLDKYYVEYRTNPNSKLKIHYSCGYDTDEMVEEEMEDAGYGIFEKELILFYGENLQYFITEETENGVEIVESRLISHTETEMASGTTKYGKINEILMTKELQDEKTLYSLLEQYYKEEYAIKRHFTPV
ncbi:MAG: hypothetical protein IKL28_03365 [Lachnospiraceae bacterium]|nr:hypothetical protein [Lachnospiraceae bacterium]